MTESIPTLGRYVVPDMPTAEQLLPWLRHIDANRWYSNYGPLNTLFEQRVAEHLAQGQLAVTTLMSCYHALQIGLQVLHLPQDAQVLVPAVTFPACPLAVQHARAVPVLADVDGATWQLTPAIARRVVAAQTIHAVMPVALYGAPVPADAWDAFSRDTGIPVIIDAAAAFGTQIIPQHCLVAHSLHATKPFAVGEGGLLISRNQAQIDEARQISNFGTSMRITVQDGSNAKLSEYHAAIGLAQLERLGPSQQSRARIYDQLAAALQQLNLPVTLQRGIIPNSAGAFMLKLARAGQADSAAAIVDRLNAKGIFAHRMYLPPLYHHPHFAGLAVVDGQGQRGASALSLDDKSALMPESETMSRSVFGMPFHVFLTDQDIAAMATRLAQALGT